MNQSVLTRPSASERPVSQPQPQLQHLREATGPKTTVRSLPRHRSATGLIAAAVLLAAATSLFYSASDEVLRHLAAGLIVVSLLLVLGANGATTLPRNGESR